MVRLGATGIAGILLLAAACSSDGTPTISGSEDGLSEPPASDEVDRVHVHRDPWCAPAPVADVAESSLDEDEAAERRSWRVGGGPGAGYEDIDEYVASETDLIIGAYVDDDRQAHVVVVDPSQADRLDEVAEHLEQRTSSQPIRVEPGCHDLRELEEVREAIRNEEVAPLPEGPLTMQLDAARSRVVISITHEPETADFIDLVKGRFGELVLFEDDQIMISDDAGAARDPESSSASRNAPWALAGGRLMDDPPHFGGARITRGYPSRCSTAFSVVDSAGGWWMATAGHCGDGEPQQVLNWQDGLYGQVIANAYPAPDVALVGSSNRQYSRNLYTGNTDTTSVRSIMGVWRGGRVVRGDNLCLSGSYYQLQCEIEVNALGVEFCNGPAGCYNDYYTGNRPESDSYFVRSGDSGGPAIGRSGDSGATARGVIVFGQRCEDRAGVGEADYIDCQVVGLAHVATLEQSFNVNVATSGGPASGTPGGPPGLSVSSP